MRRISRGILPLFLTFFVAALFFPLSVRGEEVLKTPAITSEPFAFEIFSTFTPETGIPDEALGRIVAEKNNPRMNVPFGGITGTFISGKTWRVFEPCAPNEPEVILSRCHEREGYGTKVSVGQKCPLAKTGAGKKTTVDKAVIDAEMCIGCEACVDACPVVAISMIDGVAKVDKKKCTGCGVCVLECPVDAISQ